MASISRDPSGTYRIQFECPNSRKRRTLRLPGFDRKAAEAVRHHVEHLIVSRITGQAVPVATARWVAELSEAFRSRLAAVDLVEEVKRLTVAEFLAHWLDNKRAMGLKPASLTAWGQTTAELTRLFGTRIPGDVTHADAEAYRAEMQARGLRPATIHRRIGHARQMFEDAKRLGHISSNPWEHVRVRAGNMSERKAYVPVADAQRVLEYCPNVWWRLLVALGRFGGLRVPSEAFSLMWTDVDWERSRLSVPSPKTEMTGKTHRIIPLFPLLRPHLEAAFEAAEEGQEYVFPAEYRRRADGPNGWVNCNLRTTLQKVIRRAGVDPWPRLWHSLRASCESDLAGSFPLAVVTKWLGNTPSVALRHYVDPTDAAYERALQWMPGLNTTAQAPEKPTQNPTQSGAVSRGQECSEEQDSEPENGSLNTPDHPGSLLNTDCTGDQWRRGESNQADKPLANLQTSHRATQNPTQAVADPILAELTAIWPLLAEIDRRHLLALAEQTLAESVFGPEDSHDSL